MPLGPWELGIILVIVIIIFGAGKLPEIGGALGRGISEFRETSRADQEEDAEEVHATDSSNNDSEYVSSDSNRQHDTASTRKNEPAKEEL